MVLPVLVTTIIFIMEVSYNYYLQEMLDLSIYKIKNNIEIGITRGDPNISDSSYFWSTYVVPSLDTTLNQSNLRIDISMPTIDTHSITLGALTVTNSDGARFTTKNAVYSSSFPSLSMDPSYLGRMGKLCLGTSGSLIFIQANYFKANLTPLMNLYFRAQSGSSTGAILTSTFMFKNEPSITAVYSSC